MSTIFIFFTFLLKQTIKKLFLKSVERLEISKKKLNNSKKNKKKENFMILFIS